MANYFANLRFRHYFETLKQKKYLNFYQKIPSHVFFFLLLTLLLNNLYFSSHFGLPDFRAVVFNLALFLEFLLISESYHGLLSSRTTIVFIRYTQFSKFYENICK